MHTQPTAAETLKALNLGAFHPISWEEEKAVRAAAAAEREADPAQCLKTAAWLEGLADQYEVAGRDWNATENRTEAARLRALAAQAHRVVA